MNCNSEDDIENDQVLELEPLPLKQLESNLYQQNNRRIFFETYSKSLSSPTVFFIHQKTNKFDYPTSPTALFQYNAILASSSRIHGAPPQIYKIFEQQARSLAKELHTDFTFDTALGFHLLATHYWGDDDLLSNHYCELASSICKRALQKPQSTQNTRNLIILQLLNPGLQDSEQLNTILQTARETEQLIQQHSPHLSFGRLGLMEVVGFTQYLITTARLLRYNENGELKLEMRSKQELLRAAQMLKSLTAGLMQAISDTQIINLVKILYSLMMGIFTFPLQEQIALKKIEEGLDMIEERPFSVALGGPRFIAIFDAIFQMLFDSEYYYLADKILKVQQSQAEMFPAVQSIFKRNKRKIGSINHMYLEGITSSLLSGNETDLFQSTPTFCLPILHNPTSIN